ncbi:MAG: helix-turn-helix domain-containing protein [Candidatus Micrarchaeia archaeon]
MEREKLLKTVKEIGERGNYLQVVIERIRSSVDLIAERKGRKFAVKVIKNIDSISRDTANELRKFAEFISAKPVIIGETSKNGALSKNMIYTRFSVECMTPEGFENLLNELPQPIAAKSVKGKIRIDGSKLRAARRINNISAEKLAKEINVSKNSIYRYEEKTAYASIETVKRINTFFKDRFELMEPYNEKINQKFIPFFRMKLDAIETRSMPFNVVAKGNTNYYEICLRGDMRTIIKRVKVLKEIKETFENNYPFFVLEQNRSDIMGLPVVKRSALKNITSESELLELVMY